MASEADPTLSAIDRLFDFVDNKVDAVARVLNRTERTVNDVKRRDDIIDATATEKKPASKARTMTTSSTALARKPHFYIVEAVKNGQTVFVVTDGGKARTECANRDFAEKLLRALEASP